jgi:hypothetical protein
MQKFMKNDGVCYTGYEIELLQQIYRHKVVHVAEPKPLIEKGLEKITWRYDDEDLSNHLRLETLPQSQLVSNLLTPFPMFFNKIFVISILKLSHNIRDSVLRPTDGYWDMLANNSVVNGRALQDCSEDAVIAMYDPKQ